jgi:hypothetical protein
MGLFGGKKDKDEEGEQEQEEEVDAETAPTAPLAARTATEIEAEAIAVDHLTDSLTKAVTVLDSKTVQDHARQARSPEDIRAELAAIAQMSEGKFIVAVITTRLPGGMRKAVEIVNVDITGKKISKVNVRVIGPKIVGLDEGLSFSVNGRSYELDSEYIALEIPNPTLFYDRDRYEPIHFFERTVVYKGQEISSIELLGHYSLRIDKVIMQKVVEIAANERPEQAKQPISRVVVAIIAILAFVLGLFAGAFILRP